MFGRRTCACASGREYGELGGWYGVSAGMMHRHKHPCMKDLRIADGPSILTLRRQNSDAVVSFCCSTGIAQVVGHMPDMHGVHGGSEYSYVTGDGISIGNANTWQICELGDPAKPWPFPWPYSHHLSVGSVAMHSRAPCLWSCITCCALAQAAFRLR
jgi:hypothetical protein